MAYADPEPDELLGDDDFEAALEAAMLGGDGGVTSADASSEDGVAASESRSSVIQAGEQGVDGGVAEAVIEDDVDLDVDELEAAVAAELEGL